jgi:hypothetical protein
LLSFLASLLLLVDEQVAIFSQPLSMTGEWVFILSGAKDFFILHPSAFILPMAPRSLFHTARLWAYRLPGGPLLIPGQDSEEIASL